MEGFFCFYRISLFALFLLLLFWRETKRWMEEGSKKIDKFPSSTLPPPFWRGKGESTSPTFVAMKRGGAKSPTGLLPYKKDEKMN